MSAVFLLWTGITFAADLQSINTKSSKIAESWKKEISSDWQDLDHLIAFKNWQNEFNKTYSDAQEEEHRFLIFLDNWEMINEFNMARNRNFTMRLNQFADLTGDEFKYYIHGQTQSCLRKEDSNDQNRIFINATTNAPESIDWTDMNGESYVTSVKNQGQCGSCWAFSATGAIESRTAIATHTTGESIIKLSEQQLIDCSGSYGNAGCNGGLMDDAFRYVEHSDGLCSESEYAYKQKQTKCKSAQCGTEYYPIHSYSDVPSDEEPSLLSAVANGPVSAAIEADQSAFQFYSGGVLDGLCGTKLDHGVLIVGYGSESGYDYWKVKNSWGTSWGMDGYVLICRNCGKNGDKGECGILSRTSFPIPIPSD